MGGKALADRFGQDNQKKTRGQFYALDSRIFGGDSFAMGFDD